MFHKYRLGKGIRKDWHFIWQLRQEYGIVGHDHKYSTIKRLNHYDTKMAKTKILKR